MGIRTSETIVIDCFVNEEDQIQFYRNKEDDLIALVRTVTEGEYDAIENFVIIAREDVNELIDFLQHYIDSPRKESY